MSEIDRCKICNLNLYFDIVQVGKKGLESLFLASETRQDGIFLRSAEQQSFRLHKRCRKAYINQKCIDAAAKRLCAGGEPLPPPQFFDFAKTCFFCNGDASDEFIKAQSQKQTSTKVSRVTSEMTKTNIIIKATNRGDEWCAEGSHALTIHEFGDLTEDCSSTGGHYNPTNKPHGHPDSPKRHVGDLGNICNEKIKLQDEVISLYGDQSIVGRSLVLHENKDDYGTADDEESKKTGNSGRPISCGIIGLLY